VSKEQNEKSAEWFIPFCFLTTLAFTILKIMHIIDWNWWWVLAPLWIPFGGFIILVLIGIIIALIINKVIK
jgi:membrane protein YdbS with pleckstrin-like domain